MSNDELSTQPTIETLLSRMNEWGEHFKGQLKMINAGVDELRKGQDELRADLRSGLRGVERKIQILNDNLLTIRADVRDLEVRLEKIEAEPLTKK